MSDKQKTLLKYTKLYNASLFDVAKACERLYLERDEARRVARRLYRDNESQGRVITDQNNLIADLQGEISALYTNLSTREKQIDNTKRISAIREAVIDNLNREIENMETALESARKFAREAIHDCNIAVQERDQARRDLAELKAQLQDDWTVDNAVILARLDEITDGLG